jgi:hypothetical protein
VPEMTAAGPELHGYEQSAHPATSHEKSAPSEAAGLGAPRFGPNSTVVKATDSGRSARQQVTVTDRGSKGRSLSVRSSMIGSFSSLTVS